MLSYLKKHRFSILFIASFVAFLFLFAPWRLKEFPETRKHGMRTMSLQDALQEQIEVLAEVENSSVTLNKTTVDVIIEVVDGSVLSSKTQTAIKELVRSSSDGIVEENITLLIK